MLKIIALRITLIGLFSISAGCNNYSVSINEKQIYSPPKIFTDFQLVDAELLRCIDAIIAENRLTKPEQVTKIICGPRNITSLEGIELFNNLEQLGLSNNNLTSIKALENAKKLKQLDISSNRVSNIEILLGLENLVYVNLEGNKATNCLQIDQIKKKSPSVEIISPQHCLASPSNPDISPAH